jgi:type IV pilus assembly protein PilA
MKKNNEKGFSLVELLVVVIIIAIIAAIAIPNLLASRRAANEASAVSSLRTISSANVSYYATNGNVYANDLATLSGANLLDPTWTGAPVKSGYTFTYSGGGSAFCVGAATTAAAGSNGYAVSNNNVIYKLAGTAAPTCAPATGVISSGSPLN